MKYEIKNIEFPNIAPCRDILNLEQFCSIKLIKKNVVNPTLINTEIQTKGKGTMGKKWISIKFKYNCYIFSINIFF